MVVCTFLLRRAGVLGTRSRGARLEKTTPDSSRGARLCEERGLLRDLRRLDVV